MTDQEDALAFCARTGHSWPWRVGNRGTKPHPGQDTCTVCGTVRVVDENGKKSFIRPTTTTDNSV